MIGHFTYQTAYVTGLGGISYCNQTLLLREGGVWHETTVQQQTTSETGVIADIGNLASLVYGTPAQNTLAILEPPSKIR